MTEALRLVVDEAVDEQASTPAGDAAQASTPTDETPLASKAIPLDRATQVPCIGLRWLDEHSKRPRLSVAAPEEAWEAAKALGADLGIEFELHAADEQLVRDSLSVSANDAIDSVEGAAAKFAAITGDAPVADLVEQLIGIAVLSRASDLHLEPHSGGQRVRLRIDGRLRQITDLPANLSASIASRLKVLAKINIVERRRPQDGQFTIIIGDRKVDVRLASSATMHGEKIVLRLLDETRPFLNLDDLGMSQNQLRIMTNSVKAREGLVFAAGPTGSGKTTTLHTALRAAYAPWKNVTTIEDPVEYVVDEINQIPILDPATAGFATQLRAILRQDPDVILVGETRDEETARISIQAALTGHLVLSSIHAIDAVGAVYRLMQMGIEPYLIASSLKCVAAQRLIRRVCKFCSEPVEPTQAEVSAMISYGMEPKSLMRGAGCTLCSGTGYRDRVAAYQVLEVTEELAEVIASHPEPGAFRQAAIASGMTTMAEEAMRLAMEGQTTIHEAMSLVDHDE